MSNHTHSLSSNPLAVPRDDANLRTDAHRHHWIAGLLPWIGMTLFVVHGGAVLLHRDAGWQQDLVQMGVIYLIGVAMLGGGIAHMFFGPRIARSIGWSASPFQWEVGCADAAMGLVALQAASFGPQYWLAIIVASGLYRIGCAVGHVRDMVRNRNFAVNNTVILAIDVAVPLALFGMWHAWA